jgi:PncC family amidohydrolase
MLVRQDNDPSRFVASHMVRRKNKSKSEFMRRSRWREPLSGRSTEKMSRIKAALHAPHGLFIIGTLGSNVSSSREGQPMQTLFPIAEKVAALLIARGETIAISESSTGGMVSAALLAVPGASAYFLGGAVVYTAAARAALLGIGGQEMAGLRSASEPYALLCAHTVRQHHGADWGLAETGAAGPAGNRYGDAAGHTCLALSGPTERVMTLETGVSDRIANMRAFAAAALTLLGDTLGQTPRDARASIAGLR